MCICIMSSNSPALYYLHNVIYTYMYVVHASDSKLMHLCHNVHVHPLTDQTWCYVELMCPEANYAEHYDAGEY